MNIEDYGISFFTVNGKDIISLDLHLEELTKKAFERKKNYISWAVVYWHGKSIATLDLKVCPSVNTITIGIKSREYLTLAEEPRKALEEILPPLKDRGKRFYATIYLENQCTSQ